jgi:hypothetical protein
MGFNGLSHVMNMFFLGLYSLNFTFFPSAINAKDIHILHNLKYNDFDNL